MTEFYINLSQSEINDLIRSKMKIYGDHSLHIETDMIKICDVKLNKIDFEYLAMENICKKHDLNPENYDLCRYVGIYKGMDVYRFHNIIRKVAKESVKVKTYYLIK
jgi:hypothetical protein